MTQFIRFNEAETKLLKLNFNFETELDYLGYFDAANTASFPTLFYANAMMLGVGPGGLYIANTTANTTIRPPTAGEIATNYVLRADGQWVAPVAGGAGTPGGLTTQIQFNDGGAFGGNASLIYSKTTNTITIGGVTTINSTFFSQTANSTNFVGSVSAANVVSNAQLIANLANYTSTAGLGGYQTTAGLAANVLTLTANSTNFVGSVSAANTVSNAQLIANLANYTNNASLSGYLINQGFLTTIPDIYVANTDSRVMAGNLNFTAANTYFNIGLFVGANVSLSTTTMFVGNTTQNTVQNTTGFYVNGTPLGLGSGTLAYGFHAHKNGTNQTSIANATYTKVTFTTETSDTGNYYDAANSRWTPPPGPVFLTSTTYNVCGTGNFAANYMAIYKNGSMWKFNTIVPTVTNVVQLSIDAVDIANGADYYEVYVWQQTASGGSGNYVDGQTDRTWFSCTSLGASSIPTGGGISRFQYTATAGQTTFSGADANGIVLAYTPGLIEVVVNGIWLPPNDYTATTSSSIIFADGLAAGDIVYVFSMSRNVTSTFNYLVNGGMQISQQNGTTSSTASGYYPVDQWLASFSHGGTSTIQQVASRTPGGSTHRIRVTATAADAAVAAGDYLMVYQGIEGYRVADLLLGQSGAQTLFLRFGCKGPAGTYCVGFKNGATNRSYVAEYTISAGEANTDVVKSVAIPGDITGTWATDNTNGLYVQFTLMAGTTWQTTAGAWAAGNYIGSANQFNFMGTINNVFELFDVGLYAGTAAPTWKLPEFDAELRVCKRYWEKSYDYPYVPGTASTAGEEHIYAAGPSSFSSGGAGIRFKTEKRIAPTMTCYSPPTGTSGKARDNANGVDVTVTTDEIGTNGCRWFASFTSSVSLALVVHWTANARN